MNVTITRKDIGEHARLLTLLEKWEGVRRITSQMDNGKIVLTKGCVKQKSVDTCVDEYHAKDNIEGKISMIAGKHANDMIEEVIDAIKQRLPLNEDKQ